ncbi:alpha/beta hydrolase family protein [Adhaeribacter soli]|uniref:Alpha/beta fold hydrolase n=1 Tax=Adhaeribacter soli TaxID=2607655 RepID=A0A5N1J755_9BACT|nr:alpha/beta fold hydrolase [Adhaeribacter soli]KAA9340541.1 alpha/beta fold hydrolase [Adhaeribacter soli]
MLVKNIKSAFYVWALVFLTILSGTACKKEAEAVTKTEAETNNLVSTSFVGYMPASAIRDLATANGYPQYNEALQYDVVVFKMVYYTTYQGKQTQASGLMCFPRNMPNPPAILSAQHGTLFAHKDAPSNFPNSFNGPELFASAGYATFIPDYLGYGASAQILHTYYNEQYSALAVIDMIKAGKIFCQQEEIPVSDKLFLAGYSEGGYVTLAAQKEIENNPAHNLKLTAVAAGAGGYDLQDMLSNITTAPSYNHPSYLAFLLQAYNTANGWNRPLTDFFQEPYASKIPALLNGSKTGSQVNAELVKQPNKLFAPAFFNALKGSGEDQVKEALKANSLTDYAPKAPTRMYHGTADDVVPFTNSQVTYNKLKANGAKDLTFHSIPGGTHGTTFQPMISELIPWFASFNK